MDTTNTVPAAQSSPATKFSSLSNIVMVIGIVEAVLLTLLIVYYLFLIPPLMTLYQDLNVEIPNPYTKLILMGLLIIIPLAEAYYGFWLKRLQKTKQELPLKHKRIIYGIFISTLLLIVFYIIGLFVSSLGPLMLLQQGFQLL